jgi:hypothetical protein
MFKGFVFSERWSEPYIASFKGFYCRNPGTRMPKIYSIERKGSIKGFIVVPHGISVSWADNPES